MSLNCLTMIEIKDLHVSVDNKDILNGTNLSIPKGSVYVLMGPNGSGKSTLANTIMGNPRYFVKGGSIVFDGEEINELTVDKRAKKGIFLSFQYPSDIDGITMSNFLKTSYKALRNNKIKTIEWQEILDSKMDLLKVDKSFKERYVNCGFSGGEKKKSEIIQMAIVNPKFAILDEADSGLDIDALQTVAHSINSIKESNPDMTILIITHGRKIIDFLNIDKILIMVNGKIVKEGDKRLLDTLESKGYNWIQKEI